MLVVVGRVLGQNLLEMAATEDEDSVEALSTGRANKTLGDRVRQSRQLHLMETVRPEVSG
jgi:hypothetical protein